MNSVETMLKISTASGSQNEFSTDPYYKHVIELLLRRILPDDLICPNLCDDDIHEDDKQRFQNSIPFFSYIHHENQKTSVSFVLLWQCKPHAFRFVFELISRWLYPGKAMNVMKLFAADLELPELYKNTLTICEISILPASEQELAEIMRNIPIIESEIRLGVQSRYFSWKILEIKGLKPDEKTVIIQEQINYLLKRKAAYFDADLINEMQHMLVMFREGFISAHASRYLSRLVSIQYLFRRELHLAVQKDPHQRYLRLKLFKTKIYTSDGEKSVLGILLAVNFIGKNEFLEERHLLKAIRNYCASIKTIEGSFVAHRRGSEEVCTLYMEIEKEEGCDFSAREISLLRSELPHDLKDRIEHLLHPVFMPRNEEDIMRNILNLSSQLKYVSDLPQVFISFDEQTRDCLLFTLIVVQVSMPGSESIQELLQGIETPLEYIHDRCKMVGMLRRKYAKQATVFRVKLKKHTFIRRDGSLDLNKARQLVVNELERILGEFRDYNGGMISKQNEQLCLLYQSLEGQAGFNEELLENFFYSFTPVVMRTVLEIQLLVRLFNFLLEVIEERLFKNGYPLLRVLETKEALLLIVSTDDEKIKTELMNLSELFNLSPDQLGHSFVQVYNVPYFCYVYLSSKGEDRLSLVKGIEGLLAGRDAYLPLSC